MTRRGAKGSSGQMTIEVAVALPALLAVALIAANALTFFAQCATFDRAACEAVRVYAASPAYGQGPGQSCSLIKADIVRALGTSRAKVSVTHSAEGGDLDRYTASLQFVPTLFGAGLRSSVFGVSMPKLVHETTYVVDSYKAGVII